MFSKAKDGRYDLHRAAKEGENDVVKMLLDRGAKVDVKDKKGNTALHMAAEAGKHETVQLLLSKGAAVSAKDYNGNTPLHKTRSCKVAEILIRNGASARDKNYLSQTALHCVVGSHPCNKELIELLIDHGADVDGQDQCGHSPFFSAVENSNAESCLVLIRRGANINLQDVIGNTPLHKAAVEGDVDVVLFMLKKGVKPDIKNLEGCTALHEAANERVMSELLAHGCSISVKNECGETPYDYLAKEIEPDCHRFLSNHVNLSKLAGLPMPVDVDLDLSEEDKLKALEELERIKSTAIGEGIYLYNAFTECSRPKYLLRDGVMENIESLLQAPDFQSQFPMYANILKGTFIRSKKGRYYLTKEATRSMMSLTRKEWCRYTPDLVWDHVFQLLEDDDLTNVIHSDS